MAGNLTERHKRVIKQSEQARDNDKLHPFEIHQSNQGTDDFPFGGFSEDAQLHNMGTRQARQYWLQHDMRVKDEQAKLRKKKKQQELADRLLRKRGAK